MKTINKTLFGTLLLVVFSLWSCEKQEQKPNIILILADDYGMMDIQAYANRFTDVPTHKMFYETPNLDKMINEGIAFSQAYVNQLCSPTRAALLTGKYAARLGFTTAAGPEPTYFNQDMDVPEGSYIHDVLYHNDRIPIEMAWMNGSSNTAVPSGTILDNGEDFLSLAEVLPDYHSAFIGKWHIGGFGAKGYQPEDQGFEELVYWDAPGSPYFDWRKNWKVSYAKHFRTLKDSSKLVPGKIGKDTGEEYLTDEMGAQAVNFIKERAEIKDQPFFLYFCHFAIHTPHQAKKEDIDHFDAKPTKGWNGHENSTYAGMVKSMDETIGAVFKALEESGQDENTLVIFMSDNGALDSDTRPGISWSNSAPFLGGKACLSEGGIRVPLVFWWKGKFNSGDWCNIPVDATDMLPTLMEVAGYDAQKVIEEQDLDGQSMLTLLSDLKNVTKSYDKNTRYWHYPFNVSLISPFDGFWMTPRSALREGDYKLIFDWQGSLRLYDIENDPYEKANLAKKMPSKTNELFAKLMTWLDENVAETYLPYLNPDYNAEKEARPVPFVNLVEAYKAGENVAELANE